MKKLHSHATTQEWDTICKCKNHFSIGVLPNTILKTEVTFRFIYRHFNNFPGYDNCRLTLSLLEPPVDPLMSKAV